MPDWHPLESTNVSSAAYDPLTSELSIRFEWGGVYIYEDVPQSVFDDLLVADSPGGFLNAQVKGTYAYRRA